MLACISPHVKQRLTPRDIFPIPSIDNKRAITKSEEEHVLQAWKDL
jgi:hypothetical protein